MTEPLTTWRCDVCGDPVTLENGYVFWDEPGKPNHRFVLAHKVKCDRNDRNASMPLRDFVGPDGLVTLTSMLSYGIASSSPNSRPAMPEMEQFVDFMRRVQIPYYEEARGWLRSPEGREHMGDANEVYPYVQTTLKHIAKNKLPDR